jgi:hypothetical protein
MLRRCARALEDALAIFARSIMRSRCGRVVDNMAGSAVCEGGLMVRLVEMKTMRADPAHSHGLPRTGSDRGAA